jgi:hypothetical protein
MRHLHRVGTSKHLIVLSAVAGLNTMYNGQIMGKPLPGIGALQPALAAVVALIVCLPGRTRAGWETQPGSIGWKQGTNLVWRFNYDAAQGKPFFHPLAVNGSRPLTDARPGDHPWHYGLWFSWKFINNINYWEQDRTTGRAEGRTRWTQPVIRTDADGRAVIRLTMEYVHPSGRIELTEQRQLVVSAPAADGSYTIDWTADFAAGTNAVTLDRTPMPGEPNGQVNGGYGGLSLRLAGPPVALALVTEHQSVTQFASNRARPDARALACNLSLDAAPIGAIAILSAPDNVKDRSPWYAVVSDPMRFCCSAILAPKPIVLGAGQTLALRYRIAVRAAPWTSANLESALAAWSGAIREAARNGTTRIARIGSNAATAE